MENTNPISDKIHLKLAKLQQEEGNTVKALQNYQKVLKENPGHILTAMDYGELLLKTNKLAEADSLFSHLTSTYPQNASFQYRLGLVKEKQQDSTAMDYFFKTVGLDSTHQAALYKTAKYQLTHNNEFNAMSLAKTGLKYKPENTSLLSILGQSYTASLQFKKAIPVYEKLVALGEETEFVLQHLAWAYNNTGRKEDAIEVYQKLLKMQPGNSSYYSQIGSIYYKLKDFEKAKLNFHMALNIKDQKLDKEYLNLGFVHKQLENHQLAYTFFNKALEENQFNERAYLEKAIAADNFYEDKQSILDLYVHYFETFKDNGDPKMLKIAEYRIQDLRKEIFQAE
nr:tetratricopeptide repeat protein [Gramella sp. AN32]